VRSAQLLLGLVAGAVAGSETAGNAPAGPAGTAGAAMNPTMPLPAAPDVRANLLRSAAVEQVMRTCDDELAVLAFLEVVPASSQAASALGRLLSENPLRLVAGCPLIALVTGAPVDPHWREAYPPRSESLYSHLEFLVSLYGPVDDVDAYGALELLRRRSEQDLDPLL
jgi:hypothetical protein